MPQLNLSPYQIWLQVRDVLLPTYKLFSTPMASARDDELNVVIMLTSGAGRLKVHRYGFSPNCLARAKSKHTLLHTRVYKNALIVCLRAGLIGEPVGKPLQEQVPRQYIPRPQPAKLSAHARVSGFVCVVALTSRIAMICGMHSQCEQWLGKTVARTCRWKNARSSHTHQLMLNQKKKQPR